MISAIRPSSIGDGQTLIIGPSCAFPVIKQGPVLPGTIAFESLTFRQLLTYLTLAPKTSSQTLQASREKLASSC